MEIESDKYRVGEKVPPDWNDTKMDKKSTRMIDGCNCARTFLTDCSDRRSIDKWCHHLNVLKKYSVEQSLISVLQVLEIEILRNWIWECLNVGHTSFDLRFD